MINALKNWSGSFIVNGMEYTTLDACNFDFNNDIHIILKPARKNENMSHTENTESNPITPITNSNLFKIRVKQYMTKTATPSFDFMAKWNNNKPMPMRIMIGEVVKETKGMVYMKLHGDIVSKVTCTCMKCCKPITNPVSQFFGMGPECGGHNYTNPFDTDEELAKAVEQYKEKLSNITWEGWIIKSAIEEKEAI